MYSAKCSCGWGKKCGKGIEGHIKAIVAVVEHNDQKGKHDARMIGKCSHWGK